MLQTKRAQASVTPGDDPGEFDMILSNGTRDRDGETISPESWAQPLPDVIPINANHSSDVSDIVASGKPFIDTAGNLRVVGKFAATPQAQHIRSLVNDGHLRSVSVEFLRRKSANGSVVNELVAGAFVNIPSNPTAMVLASKSMDDTPPEWFIARMMGEPDAMAMVMKAAGGDAAMVAAIHDAAVHLGAQCLAAPPDEDDGSDDGANKALRLMSLRLKALRG